MIRRLSWIGLLGWLLAARADDIALVSVGDSWRFQLGTLEPSLLPKAWTREGFDDSGWFVGDSGFGYSPTGYGENTPIPDGTGLYVSAYFRHRFPVENPSQIRTLTLRADWQGGFAAFLNGTEILQVNLTNGPAGFIPFDQRAGFRDPLGAVDFDVPAAIPLLKTGTNVLAIQLHSGTGTAYAMVLVPELLANFTRGPLARNITSSRATILWETSIPTAGRVEYGVTADLGSVVEDPNPATHHVLDLSSLPAGREVFYRVGIRDGPAWISSPLLSLRTLPASGDVRWIVLGDTGAGTAGQFAIARRFTRRSADVVLHLGDVVYPMFTFPYTDTRCLSVYREALRSTPFYFVWGNHDLYAGEMPFIRALLPPTNSLPLAEHLSDNTRPEFFYSFDAGDVHLAVVYQPFASQYLITTNSPQLRWLEADLKASKKPWKWIALHHPLNTSGLHRRDDRNLDGLIDRQQIGNLLYPLARRTGVQLVLAGHDHSYERLRPTNGVHHLVSGGGGSVLYPLSERDAASAHFESRHHFVEVTVHDDVLRWVAVGTGGEVFDSTEFRRTDPDSGSWSSPLCRRHGSNRSDRDRAKHVSLRWISARTDGAGCADPA